MDHQNKFSLHEFVCYPCTEVMLIFVLQFFCICAAKASTDYLKLIYIAYIYINLTSNENIMK